MTSLMHLPQNKRDVVMSNLNDNQREFLASFLKRGKKTIFANLIAKEKAGGNDVSDIAQHWELVNYIDAGPNWRSLSTLFCECGRPLRYQYIVKNSRTEETKRFGIDHFKEHTGISPHLANEIKKGFETIDYELDEILLKFSNGWSLSTEGIDDIPQTITVPDDVQAHFDYDIPLLQRQMDRLKEAINRKHREDAAMIQKKRRQKMEAALLEEDERKRADLVKLKQEISRTEWWLKIKGNKNIGEELQLGIVIFMKETGRESFLASDVCDYLVTYHQAPADRLSSGTYYIFPNVCMFLEELANTGRIQFVKKIEGIDRLYHIKDPFLLSS